MTWEEYLNELDLDNLTKMAALFAAAEQQDKLAELIDLMEKEAAKGVDPMIALGKAVKGNIAKGVTLRQKATAAGAAVKGKVKGKWWATPPKKTDVETWWRGLPASRKKLYTGAGIAAPIVGAGGIGAGGYALGKKKK